MYAVLYVLYRHREHLQADETTYDNCECYVILSAQSKFHRVGLGRSAVVPYSFSNHRRLLMSSLFRALNTFHLICTIYTCNWYVQPYPLDPTARVLKPLQGNDRQVR